MAVVAINASLAFYAWLLTTILLIIILAFYVRIPLKRRHHWVFLLFVASLTWFAGIGTLGQAQLTVQGYYSLLSIQNFAGIGSYLSYALLYLFVVQFKSRTMTVRQKLILSGIFGYDAFASVLLIVDAPLFFSSARATPTGYVTILGPYTSLERPFGLYVPQMIFAIVILFQITSSYRITKSPLLRGQLKYLAGATLLQYVAAQLNTITSLSQSLPAGSFQVSRALVAGILLVGLTRHGFYGAVPTTESASAIPLRYSLQDGCSFLARDHKAAFEAFSELVRNGRNGLCISRTFPDEIRKTYGLQTTPIRWLAEEKRDDAIPPGDLVGLSLTVKDFVSKTEKPIVILHGIEYLATINGFSPILRLVHGLNDASSQRNGILLFPVLPGTLEKRDDALLSAETTPLPKPIAS